MSDVVLGFISKIIWAVLCFICGWLSTKYKRAKQRSQTIEDDTELIKEALRHTLRGVLRDDYECFTHRGYCSVMEKEEFSKTYITYHKLHGNGVATHMDEVVMRLPDEPPTEHLMIQHITQDANNVL